MPPSGYSGRQAASIVEFLRSCSAALKAEAERDKLSLLAGLKREIEDIQALIKQGTETAVAVDVLRLTGDFYGRVARTNPSSTPEYDEAVCGVLDQIGEEIRAIHVPPGLAEKMLRREELETV